MTQCTARAAIKLPSLYNEEFILVRNFKESRYIVFLLELFVVSAINERLMYHPMSELKRYSTIHQRFILLPASGDTSSTISSSVCCCADKGRKVLPVILSLHHLECSPERSSNDTPS